MSEQKRYTAQELRKAAEIMPKSFSCCERCADGSERILYGDDYSAMLCQAADTEEENIKLKEQNEWYEHQPELMGETAREALSLLKAQEAEIAAKDEQYIKCREELAATRERRDECEVKMHKAFERVTKAEQKIAAKDAEIEILNKRLERVVDDRNMTCGLCEPSKKILELSKCLKEAVDYNCALCKSKGEACEVEGFCAEHRWRKALEGMEDGK